MALKYRLNYFEQYTVIDFKKDIYCALEKSETKKMTKRAIVIMDWLS